MGRAAFVAILMLVGVTPLFAMEAGAAVDTSGCTNSPTVLPRNDDSSSGEVNLPFSLNYFGAYYTSLYVNNNGNVTFDEPLSTYVPFDLEDEGVGAPLARGGFLSGKVTVCVWEGVVSYLSEEAVDATLAGDAPLASTA